MTLKSTTLFRFFGFKIKADISWLFLSVLICWTMATKVFPHIFPGQSDDLYQLMGAFTVIGIAFSIIVHEVAHAVIAEYYHMPIASITLFIFGGVAEMKGEPSHPKGEFFMAIAGPIMSGLLGLCFSALADIYVMFIGKGPVPVVLDILGTLNLLIAVLNLVPAFPLDGGRALRAYIWHKKNNLVLGTRIAANLGAVFSYGLMAWACYEITVRDDMVSGMWNGVTGFLILSAGRYTVRQIESRSLLASETVMRFMNDNIITVSPDLTLTDLIDHYINRHHQKSFPVIDQGQLVGIVSLHAVLALDRHKWHWLHVASVMEPPSETTVVAPDCNAADALDLMQRKSREHLLVVDNGKLLGVVSFYSLASYLTIAMKIDHNKPVEKSRRAY